MSNLKCKIYQYYYSSSDGGTTWVRSVLQYNADTVDVKDHRKVKWRRLIDGDGNPYKQRLRRIEWGYDSTNVMLTKGYHIEILSNQSIATQNKKVEIGP